MIPAFLTFICFFIAGSNRTRTERCLVIFCLDLPIPVCVPGDVMEFLVEYTRKKRVIRSSPAMFITSLYQSFKFEKDTVWCVEM